MINNIVIVGIDRAFSKQVAEMVAEQLGMHMLDTIELFEFDNIPRTLADILKEKGEAYFRKKEKSLSGYVSEFENTILHVESGCALEESNIQKLKENAVIVYLKSTQGQTKAAIKTRYTDNIYLNKFFNISIKKISERNAIWIKNADIVIDIKNDSALKSSANVIRAIENYFLN